MRGEGGGDDRAGTRNIIKAKEIYCLYSSIHTESTPTATGPEATTATETNISNNKRVHKFRAELRCARNAGRGPKRGSENGWKTGRGAKKRNGVSQHLNSTHTRTHAHVSSTSYTVDTRQSSL